MGCVMIMAGGTGGHVYPALALADELKRRGEQVFWLGVPGSFEARVVPQAGISMQWINVEGLRGGGLKRAMVAPFKIIFALLKTMLIIRQQSPQLVVGMGGYVTGPGGIAAWLMGIPLIIHEQNRIPGFTNKVLARFAVRILEAFPGTFNNSGFSHGKARLVSVGNPVRKPITCLPQLKTVRSPLRLLVMGGSLGAQILNQSLAGIIAQLPEHLRPLIRHQSGRNKQQEAVRAYADAAIKADVYEFIDDMAAAYAWADLVICRAGALTVSELAAAGKASILIPYPHAVDDHQTANAGFLVDAGAGRIVQQCNFACGELTQTLHELLSQPEIIEKMAANARDAAIANATERTADLCLEALHQ